ncbi:hypothetical protein PVAND_014584 [Polypedilum vanderplanki]|uniref:Uncharacterized protein n=1 Tax=Polypedilum vanderplanki TaxID=319348 RepID=A0A9J6BAC9_POLVA|nr:hypothetical protein PVAND_014584 [Polypedilum vanderplanki]
MPETSTQQKRQLEKERQVRQAKLQNEDEDRERKATAAQNRNENEQNSHLHQIICQVAFLQKNTVLGSRWLAGWLAVCDSDNSTTVSRGEVVDSLLERSRRVGKTTSCTDQPTVPARISVRNSPGAHMACDGNVLDSTTDPALQWVSTTNVNAANIASAISVGAGPYHYLIGRK